MAATKKKDPRDEPFTCVECGQEKKVLHYNDRPLHYHPSVVDAGKAKPGPYCRTCVRLRDREQAAKLREESFQREEARIASFTSATKPEEVSNYIWSAMRSYACCPKARPKPCVCAHSFNCPEHGETHVGSHD